MVQAALKNPNLVIVVALAINMGEPSPIHFQIQSSDLEKGQEIGAILVYLVMVALFQSFIDPIIVLLAVPLGFIGVVVVLVATGTPLSIMSFMGIIMGHAQQSSQHGNPRVPATIEGYESADLYAKVGGYLKSVSVDLGDAVKE